MSDLLSTINASIYQLYEVQRVNSNNIFTISNYSPSSVSLDSTVNGVSGTAIYIKLQDYLPELKKYYIHSVKVKLKMSDKDSSFFYLCPLLQKFSAGSAINYDKSSTTSSSTDDGYEYLEATYKGKNAATYGFFLFGFGTVDVLSIDVKLDYTSPYYIGGEKNPSQNATISRYDNIYFSWQLASLPFPNNPSDEDKTNIVAKYIFLWHASDDSIVNEIELDNKPYYKSVPNQFSNNNILYWSIKGQMENGLIIHPRKPISAVGDNPTKNEWYTLNLTDNDTEPSAAIIYPNNTVIDGTKEIIFSWLHTNISGTPQTRADIQTGSTPDQLTGFATIQGAANTYSAPANSFTAGDLYWRVRTYNADGVAGEWSETAHIIVISASPAPLLILERISPRPIIRWETVGQVACEVEIVRIETSQQYGSVNRYEAKTILEAGIYTIRVRIQNQYSLWSPWAEASLTVFNSPGGTISLAATASKTGEVQLSWSTTGAFASCQILRNGAVIGETTERSYLDRLAIGACSYQIRGIVDSAGDYSLSGVQALTVTVPTVAIAPVSGGDWLALPYTTTDIREVSVSLSKSVTYQQFLGSPLPVGVIGETLSKSVQLSCAFPYRLQADAAKLEALIGQLVCVKDPRGRRYLGILGSMSHVSSRFYLSYSLTITPVACEEVEL